ncbi:MAG: response regulator, partial [Candidatus Latescibacteria bacterium]|nr:response regulator [Candidatus Latescibacterota bacterium]
MAHLDSPRVLIIDDDRLFLEIASKNLERADFKVEVSDDPREGARRAIDEEFDLILLDLRLPEMSGEEVLGLLKSLSIQRPVAIVTAEGSEAYRERARDLGAAAYIQKPV